MKFTGFPARLEFTPVPSLFVNQLAPLLSEGEVRLMLAVFNIMYSKKGALRCITEAELSAHPGLRGTDLGELLQSLCAQEILLPLAVVQNGQRQQVYFLNTPAERQAREKFSRGELKLPAVTPTPVPLQAAPLPDVFTLYEQNIGLITPLIADELKDALDTYPEAWVKDAIKEAVSLRKYSMRYIARILERWHTEGKGNGAYQPDSAQGPDKYVRGRYGRLVQR